jgi:hypothetical protein
MRVVAVMVVVRFIGWLPISWLWLPILGLPIRVVRGWILWLCMGIIIRLRLCIRLWLAIVWLGIWVIWLRPHSKQLA